ncbi:DUF6083 domain-containing protein [Streptomyces cinnamoneus]|uniref:Uncharacterized protein n=1 Tax=Streptomyces cinnamoneus TaxID=53446 RepID=A0A918TRJ2_STRCJ|nr:hypothetical protein GCM10010507_38230 [Streptomyces cinnamoneus]
MRDRTGPIRDLLRNLGSSEAKEEIPPASVPAGYRWFITDDGRATNWAGQRPVDAMCRIAHRHVCSHRTQPEHLAPIFTFIWLRNRVNAGLPYE